MKKYMLMAALAATMAVPATASAAPADLRAEYDLYNASADIVQPSDDPNALLPLVPAGDQIGTGRYEERAEGGVIQELRQRWRLEGARVFDNTTNTSVPAPDDSGMHAHNWSDVPGDAFGFLDQGFNDTDPGPGIFGAKVQDGRVEEDARFRLGDSDSDVIREVDAANCNVVVIVDEDNHNASAVSDTFGTC